MPVHLGGRGNGAQSSLSAGLAQHGFREHLSGPASRPPASHRRFRGGKRHVRLICVKSATLSRWFGTESMVERKPGPMAPGARCSSSPRGEIVEHAYVMAPVEKCFGQVRSNEYLHRR